MLKNLHALLRFLTEAKQTEAAVRHNCKSYARSFLSHFSQSLWGRSVNLHTLTSVFVLNGLAGNCVLKVCTVSPPKRGRMVPTTGCFSNRYDFAKPSVIRKRIT